MKSRHITEILDQTAFAELGAEDLTIINAHVKDCQNCQKAFEAARLSSVWLSTQAVLAPPAPSPFFQAKVLNAIRNKQNMVKPIAVFKRWWNASAALVFSMLMAVAFLIALTALAPADYDNTQAEISGFNPYSTEAVLFNQRPSRDLTTEQVFQVIYEPASDSER